MGKSVFHSQAVICARLIHGVQVLALDVLDDGDEERLAVRELADDRGDRIQAGLARGQESTLAGDDLERAARRSEQDRLEDPALPDRAGQLLDGLGIELGPRLGRIPDDLVECDVLDLALARLNRPELRSNRHLAIYR